MSKMLSLAEGILAIGERYHTAGRLQEAHETLHRLLRQPEVSSACAAAAHRRLGELHLARRQYERARRHLARSVKLDTENAEGLLLLARATIRSDADQWRLAARHYRAALRRRPDDVEILQELGLLLARNGRGAEGLRHLRRAAALQPESPDAVRQLARGLRHAGRTREAVDELRSARFSHPRDPRFVQLWADFQFRLARRRQQRSQIEVPVRSDGPVLLPFVRQVG